MSKVNRGISKSRQVQRKHNKLPLIMALAGAAVLIVAAFLPSKSEPILLPLRLPAARA
jgi:hypothetical protein